MYRGDVTLTETDLLDTEELALSGVAAHLPEDDLREEQRLVGTLLELTERVTPADDSKLTRLRGWLEGFRAGRRGERVIVFTEYRDTLEYLHQHLGMGPLLRVDGTVPLSKRRGILERFAGTPGAILAGDRRRRGGLEPAGLLPRRCPLRAALEPQQAGAAQRPGRPVRTARGGGDQLPVPGRHRDEEILQRLPEKLAEITASQDPAATCSASLAAATWSTGCWRT